MAADHALAAITVLTAGVLCALVTCRLGTMLFGFCLMWLLAYGAPALNSTAALALVLMAIGTVATVTRGNLLYVVASVVLTWVVSRWLPPVSIMAAWHASRGVALLLASSYCVVALGVMVSEVRHTVQQSAS